ncbi:hypothetical protein BDW69DRAFT_188116 [Aspergillus filifer]
MSRHTHSTSKHPRPLIATLDGATESLFKYLDKTILGSFTTLETLLRDCEYNSQNKLIAECRFAYLKWVAESNLTDTSKRADSRLIGTAASHTLERLVTLLTDLDSTLYSAAYIMRKRQVNGRMVDWFVRDVQIALGRVEDFMDEWWGDEEGSGPGPEDMRTPMPGDFFNAERFETEIKEDVEGRKHAERLEVEARELAEEAEARVRKRAERVDGRGGGSGRYAQGLLVGVKVPVMGQGANMPINMHTTMGIRRRISTDIIMAMHMGLKQGGTGTEHIPD